MSRSGNEHDRSPDRERGVRAPDAEPGRSSDAAETIPAALLAMQRSAGNAAVGAMLARRRRPPRPPVRRADVQRKVVIGPTDISDRKDGEDPVPGPDSATSAPAPHGTTAPAEPGQDGPPQPPGDGAGGGGAGESGGTADGAAAGDGGGAGGSTGGAGQGSGGAADGGGQSSGGAVTLGPEQPDLTPTSLNGGTAASIADLAQKVDDPSDVSPSARQLLTPPMRQAAAELVPDRAEDLGVPAPQEPGARVQRRAASDGVAVQRGEGTGSVPTVKLSVKLPWEPIPIAKEREGGWFMLGGEIEAPTWEGTAKPPDSMRDDTKEIDFKADAEGRLEGVAVTLHQQELWSSGDNAKLDGKIAVETTKDGVKVTGATLTLPDLGGDSPVVLQGQFDFDLLDWPAGKPPKFMVLSYTKKIGIKSKTTKDGWEYDGRLFVPIKLTLRPSPAKVAEYVTRVIGPRVAAAAPAGLAIAAPLFGGAVCLAIWANAVQAGKDFAEAYDMAKQNTVGYVAGYFDAIYGYAPSHSNAGAAAGKKDADRVLNGLRWNELSEGAKAKIRAEYLKEGTLDLAGAQQAAWSKYKAKAMAHYRSKHSVDAWMYDNGLGGDLAKLERMLNAGSPPWSLASY